MLIVLESLLLLFFIFSPCRNGKNVLAHQMQLAFRWGKNDASQHTKYSKIRAQSVIRDEARRMKGHCSI